MILWSVGNALLAFVALPIIFIEAFRIMRSLTVVTSAARDIASSVQSVAGTVPAVAATVSGIASGCGDLERAVVR